MWRPSTPGKQRCDEHGTEFRVGHACPDPACKHPEAGTPQPSDAEQLAAEAKRRSMPGLLDHEQVFARRALRAERFADELKALSITLLTKDKRTEREFDEAMRLARAFTQVGELGRKNRREAADLCTIREAAASDEQLVATAERVKRDEAN